MFMVIATHQTMFIEITASWQYFEAGHGKGPCDGVGGTAKRQADSAVKRQICSIQNADDFYAWGCTQESSNLHYMFVSSTKCNDTYEELKQLNIKPVKSTMNVHSVVPLADNCIAVRDTSCFCHDCFSDGLFHPQCSGWTTHIIESTVVQSNQDTDMNNNNLSVNDVSAQEHINADDIVRHQYGTNTFVAALYDEKWYISKILEYDPEDNSYQMSFMTEGSNKRGVTFKWPEKEDILWLPHSDIVCAVEEPTF